MPPAPPPLDKTNLDNTIEPSDDFYRYANGTWDRNAQIPADKEGLDIGPESAARFAEIIAECKAFNGVFTVV